MAVEPERPLLADVHGQLRGLAAELRELIALRWQLARLEIQSDLASAKRFSTVGAAAVVLGLTGLALLASCAAELLDGWLSISRAGWLAILGAVLLAAAASLGLAAWRRFRREFCGMEETVEELREDLLWFQEWTHTDEEIEGGESGTG